MSPGVCLLAMISPPDKGIMPGVFEWMSGPSLATSRDTIHMMFSKLYHGAWVLLGLLLMVSAMIQLFGAMSNWHTPVDQLLLKGAMVVLMLVGYQYSFGVVMRTGYALAQQIQETPFIVDQLRMTEEKLQQGQGDSSWASWAFTLLKGISGQLELVTIIVGLGIMLYFVICFFMTSLWVVLATVLYITGPLVLVMAIFPGGGKLAARWFGALLQLSLWQVWFAICYWFMDAGATKLLQGQGLLINTVDWRTMGASTMLEGLAFAVLFGCMYLGTPYVVQAIFPLGSVESGTMRAMHSGARIFSRRFHSGREIVHHMIGGSHTRRAPAATNGKVEVASSGEAANTGAIKVTPTGEPASTVALTAARTAATVAKESAKKTVKAVERSIRRDAHGADVVETRPAGTDRRAWPAGGGASAGNGQHQEFRHAEPGGGDVGGKHRRPPQSGGSQGDGRDLRHKPTVRGGSGK